MKKILTGVGVGFCLPFILAYAFVALGGMPVAIKGKPLPLEKYLARKALHVAMDPEVGETYWKVKNGIRLTGMPGYSDSLSASEMWQVSLLLLHADKLPAPVLEYLRQAAAFSAAPAPSA